jgi:hypothetical protein
MGRDQDLTKIHHTLTITYINQSIEEINHHNKLNLKVREKIVVLNLNWKIQRPLPLQRLNYTLIITTIVSLERMPQQKTSGTTDWVHTQDKDLLISNLEDQEEAQ